ncbi:MAG: B12-binding domain-containing radical SAM protein [Candidatus Cloacimonadota bacterium]|nr:MAG: B12-binding domain-containing radical SAM protein [Candidatus Cloacimonadota bacterium]
MKFTKISYDKYLHLINKPGRYVDHELNAWRKTPSEKTVNFVFVFPDVYEVGVSHLGLKILYSILNRQGDSMADRCYAPWPDLGDLLKKDKVLLAGIESQIALKDFDAVGFTMQSELTFTNVLYVMDLAEIPVFGTERTDDDPVVLAGGPAITNPEPMSDFFDAVLIGDGEEAIIEIKDIIKDNRGNRKAILEGLSKIPGVYVPSHPQNNPVKIRKYMKFSDNENTHSPQLVPWIQATHNRYTSEIMRGCSRGCRFCHAGMFYRPVRERNPESVLKKLIDEVEEFGWDEVALVSLSSSDYTCIKPLMTSILERLKDSKTSLSLPSLRVDSLDRHLVKLMNTIGQSGLTIAPEAGSQRLRNVINKNLSEEDILDGVRIALENGWRVIKLYFMVGLPFEEESDIDGIIDLVEKIISMAGKRLQINITLSPFVPKPFTPFQWSRMDDRENIREKCKRVKGHFSRKKFVKISYHTLENSMLEAVISRGDKKIGKWIYGAFRNGAKFDGWTECFDWKNWLDSASENGIDLQHELRERNKDECLPWESADIGISKIFLLSEIKKAENEATTEDCRKQCSACGLCDGEIKHTGQKLIETPELTVKPHDPLAGVKMTKIWYRFYYEKLGNLKFVSHLDMMRMIQRIIVSSGLPLAFSQGYNPRPKLNMSAPLSLGVEGFNEFFDFALTRFIEPEKVKEKIKDKTKGLFETKSFLADFPSGMRSMEIYTKENVECSFPSGFDIDFIDNRIHEFGGSEEWLFTRVRKKKPKTADMKKLIHELSLKERKLSLTKSLRGAGIYDILDSVFDIDRDTAGELKIRRVNLIMDEEMFESQRK